MVEPIVVGAGHADRPVFILNRGVGEALSRIEDGEFDLILVQKIQPMIRLRAVSATGPAAFLPERAQIAVHGEAGPEGIALVPLEIFVWRSDELTKLFVQLHHMAVGVDNSIITHFRTSRRT